MSLKIFFLSNFGLIKSTAKIEKEYAQRLSAYEEYCKVEKSDELKTFTELETFIQSKEFSEKEKEIKNLKYKGSQEEALLKEFTILSKNKNLRKFYDTLQSAGLKRFYEIKDSKNLTEYLELQKFMQDGSFAAEKKKSDVEIFKGSQEEGQLKELKNLQKSKAIKIFQKLNNSTQLKNAEDFTLSEELKKYESLKVKVEKGKAEKKEKKQFKQLKKSSSIKSYFRFINSSAYKIFRGTKNSPTLKRFYELKEITESNDFLSRKAYLEDKKKFEKTEAFEKSQKYKELKASDDIIFYFKFEKSSAWKNFQQMENSKERNRFEELKELVNSEDFLARKAYLEDTKKWEKTEEYKKLQQYNELKQLPHIQRYFKHKAGHYLDFLKNWKVVFSDDFSSAKLDTSKWQTISYKGKISLGKNYSQPGDLQAYTSGENIKTDGKTVKIETREEKVKGTQWQMPFGFIEKEFNYTSGCINSNESFRSTSGIWEAKVKYTPKKGIASALYLEGDTENIQIKIVENGIKNRVGLLSSENGQTTDQTQSISGLKSGRFYIFRLEWHEGKMKWKINNKEILAINNSYSGSNMFINVASIVVDEKTNGLPYSFEIDWIKVYKEKEQ